MISIDNYTVIDIETTGLSPIWDSIIELSAIRVRDGVPVDTYSTLVNPGFEIPNFISMLTGITNDELKPAPKIEKVLPEYLDFIGSDILLGHNVHFDVNFIYDNAQAMHIPPPRNDMIDTMRIGRWLLPDLGHYRLPDVSQALNIQPIGAHRGLIDCQTTQQVYELLKTRDPSFFTEEHQREIARSRYNKKKLDARDIVKRDGYEDADNPLFGKVCVFTGTLDRMTRKEAMQMVTDIGGICANGVTKNTNYLVLGNNDYCSSIQDGKSNKQKKAEDLISRGFDLSIMPEDVFYELIQSEG